MLSKRHMKQARRVNNGELVQGFLFYMQFDGCEVCCIGVEPLAANDYSEIYSSCYYEVDEETVEDVEVRAKAQSDRGFVAVCPNCSMVFVSADNYCKSCGQRIAWA